MGNVMKPIIHHINGACYASLILISAYAYGQHQAQQNHQPQNHEVALYTDMLETINPKR